MNYVENFWTKKMMTKEHVQTNIPLDSIIVKKNNTIIIIILSLRTWIRRIMREKLCQFGEWIPLYSEDKMYKNIKYVNTLNIYIKTKN